MPLRSAALEAVVVRGAINSCIFMPLRLAIMYTRTRRWCLLTTRYLVQENQLDVTCV
jgi:hypothetical protein